MTIHQFNPDMPPDSEFVQGELRFLVAGNAGRLLDRRRTPVRVAELDLATGQFACEILDFEDRGARWDVPFESVSSFQFARGAACASERDLTRFAVGTTMPDRTFLLDVPVDVIVARSHAREADRPWDRFEARERAFHERLREGYLRLAAAEPRRFVVIPGDRDEADIASQILREVDALLATPA